MHLRSVFDAVQVNITIASSAVLRCCLRFTLKYESVSFKLTLQKMNIKQELGRKWLLDYTVKVKNKRLSYPCNRPWRPMGL
jgi:hypothetical protein